MGYTHYFTRKEIEHNPELFELFAQDVKKVYKKLSKAIIIKGGDGTGAPTIDGEEICFNGDGSKDLAHETLYIPRVFDFGNMQWKKDEWNKEKQIFDFCKTARKPYDIFVVAVLALYKFYFNDKVMLGSDGDFTGWLDGLALVQDTLGTRFTREAKKVTSHLRKEVTK